MSAVFDIKEHVVEGQHIREYPRATAHSQEEVLKLAVKQYIPKDNPNPKPGDVTILASHANGFVKVRPCSRLSLVFTNTPETRQELYEPLWEDLVYECRRNGVNVRGIWMADIAWQGQSGIINEDKLGNDRKSQSPTSRTLRTVAHASHSLTRTPASWFDHARDLLHLTNVLRAEMPRPLIGVGHSFGGNIIINVALMHPRLFSGLVMIDPVVSHRIRYGPLYGFATMRASASRRDLWPDRAAAEGAARRSPFYATWDPRAVERLARHGYRACPTRLYQDRSAGEVTLATSKHMECVTYYRPTHQGPRDPRTGRRTFDRRLIPDATDETDDFPNFPFYAPPSPMTAVRLGEIRPGVLWVAGETSTVCTPETQREKMELTGYGWGGSGGAKAGRVKEFVVTGVGHLVAMERPREIGERAATFIRDEVDRWRQEEELYRKEWVEGVDDREKIMMDKDFLEWMKSVGPEANRRKDGWMAGPNAKL